MKLITARVTKVRKAVRSFLSRSKKDEDEDETTKARLERQQVSG